MEPNLSYRLYLKNIKQLLPVSANKSPFLRINQANSIEPLANQSILINHEGIIAKIGTDQDIQNMIQTHHIKIQATLDCSQLVAIPGFVDAHTHALFAGDRSKQFDMKLNGKTYVDIFNEGLGIRYTTESINNSSLEELVAHLDKYLPKMSKLGTTTVEIKSGYGLNADAEVKMLKAIEIARKKYQDVVEIIATFCGAHAIPKGKTEEQQTKDVIQKQIPAVKLAIDQKQIRPIFIDVFCEKKFFQEESSAAIMTQGKKIGLIPSFHGDQLNNLESGQIAGKVGATAVSHLEYLSQESIKVMSEKQIVGVLLPTTQNIEKLPIPPIKLMRAHNMIVALGSDFCPNAYCYNMALVSHFSCTNYRMTPKQAIVAATLNSAFALGVSEKVGSIEQGKQGDILLLDAHSWVYLVYNFGDSLISKVIKKGKIL